MKHIIKSKTVIVFTDEKGKEPFNYWLNNLRDLKGKRRIAARILRLESGLYGDCEPVGEGVLELRMFFGSGYRVYFGEDKKNIVVLLFGGNKSTQKKDVKTAKEYWKEYKENGQ
ncbi:MAG: type II toxin-antitoxin system RelE/ParE family toxin [Alphaproteobacteria bacterium]|nr:type II toxin-antitoxin system RelE/ParE family toxin [Alphaproteobacteria bacterium]MCK5658884.1 type II toxin-antitoxin system RelE/ParE family toxin [Alphaproteobacteria bacterium]